MSENGGSNPYDEQSPYGQPNNPDPYGDAPRTNPYGSAPQPNPYASYGPPQPGTGGPGYGAPGYDAGPKRTDGMSIGALVASVIGLCTCIGSVVGIVLGIIGLSRTKEGRAGGRGFAIAGIVLGAVGIVLWILGVVVLAIVGFSQVVTPSNAEVGQCVDIDHRGDKISMVKADCDDDHDGQIVGVGKVTSDNLDQATKVSFCATLVSPGDLGKINRPDLTIGSVTENPDHMEVGDHVVCYVKQTSGRLSEDLLD